MRQLKIMVPLDGSRFAEAALPVALGLARNMDGQVRLVRAARVDHAAHHRRYATILPGGAEPVNQEASDYVNEVAQEIANRCNVPIFASVIPGSAGKALVDYFGKAHPDLIVMATHGRGPLSAAWVGSVADWAIRHTSVPVLLVRPSEGAERSLDDSLRFRHIMTLLDGSKQANASLKWARSVGRAFGAEQTLMCVTKAGRHDNGDGNDIAHCEQRENLRAIESEMRDAGIKVSTVVGEGPPAPVILEKAADLGVDLIVLTSHGRSRLPRLMLGSVADKIVRAAQVPVLLVRPDQ
jgi:nucleotide-binding universal stress UspA family protein